MEGTPVVVVFLRIPVVRPARLVPLSLFTLVAPCVPVTSPASDPVNDPALPVTFPEIGPVAVLPIALGTIGGGTKAVMVAFALTVTGTAAVNSDVVTVLPSFVTTGSVQPPAASEVVAPLVT